MQIYDDIAAKTQRAVCAMSFSVELTRAYALHIETVDDFKCLACTTEIERKLP